MGCTQMLTGVWLSLMVVFISPLPQATNSGIPCLYEGHLKTDRNWFGFLANITIMTTGRMTYVDTRRPGIAHLGGSAPSQLVHRLLKSCVQALI